MFIDMPDQPDQALATLLKQLREEREITQEQLAFITASALSRIERGLNSPGWMTLRRIVEALDVSLIELVSALERKR
jgi:transcriptional regulator with XRE-family HTH domain